jgi:hypothetical protein
MDMDMDVDMDIDMDTDTDLDVDIYTDSTRFCCFGSNRNKPKLDQFRFCFGLFHETFM